MLSRLAEIVMTVGALLMQTRQAGFTDGEWVGSQFKAKADLLAHEELVRHLSCLASEFLIVSEEDSHSLVENRPEQYWLIDPIDGTASFVQGYSGFVVQAALMSNHQPILSAIYAPASKCLYTAERGRGSYLNGDRLSRNDSSFPPRKLIDNYPEPKGITLEAFNELHFSEYIECGSIALKICKVADGSADLFFKDVEVRDWDLAPAQLVLEEAGGILTDVKGVAIDYTGSYKQNGVLAISHPDSGRFFTKWYLSLAGREI